MNFLQLRYGRGCETVFLMGAILLALPVLISCGKVEHDVNNSDNLKPLFSFGSEGWEILTHPQYIATNGINSIFISDQITSRVFRYNLQGELQGIIGGEGRGPGEFIYPSSLEVDEEWLYVQDTGNMRMVLFSLDDNRSRIINQDRPFIEFEVDGGYLYGFAPGTFTGAASELGEALIRVYDKEGKLVNSFGD